MSEGNGKYSFKLHETLKYFNEYREHWICYIIIFLFGIFIRLCVASGNYSGKNTPPMYGDFEAQRHWMEITYNINVNNWYENSTHNNLTYWGLDYPPLTGYHSYLFGKLYYNIYPDMIELNKSHGIETNETIFLMRISVIISDIIFILSIFIFFEISYNNIKWYIKHCGTLLMLINPLFIIIDHGHFQYNCIGLGLTIWGIICYFNNKYYIGSILFVCSLCFKQMGLYYSISFFSYCVGISFKEKNLSLTLIKIIKFGIIVMTSFIIIFLPWILNGNTLQVIKRIFPFERGLFQDKLCNFWSSTYIIYKWNIKHSQIFLKLSSIIMILLYSIPSNIILILKPTKRNFLYSLIQTSLGFFLFGYQVHEKNILYPMCIISLFILESPIFISSIICIGMFSMTPLFIKDKIMYFYWILNIQFHFIILLTQPIYKFLKPNTINKNSNNNQRLFSYPIHKFRQLWLCIPYFTIFMHFVSKVKFAERYPHIGVYLIMIYSFIILFFVGILFFIQQLLENWPRNKKFIYDVVILSQNIKTKLD